MLPGTQGRSKFPRPAAADGKATKVAMGPVPLHLFLPVGSRRKGSGCGSTPACQLQHGDVAFLFICALPTTRHLVLLCTGQRLDTFPALLCGANNWQPPPGESPSLQWGHGSGAAQPPGQRRSILQWLIRDL